MERHQAAIAVANVIIFLRHNGHVDKALQLDFAARQARADPGVLAAAWLEPV
jgi:hypothetical protein